MKVRFEKVARVAENNIYSGVNLPKGAIVFLWTLLCLFLINKSSDFLFSAAFGGAYYLSLVVFCLLMFKGIDKYLRFPGEKKEIPVFIGHRIDTLFTYPLLLMALIGMISSMLEAAGFSASGPENMNAAGGVSPLEFAVRSVLLSLTAFAEELLNLILVSIIYKNIRLRGNYRLIGSIFSAALVFGILHTFGWGLYASIPIALAYVPAFMATLYTGNIWISFLAHFYNDLISFTKYYYGGYHYIIIAGIALIPAVWAIAAILRKKD